MTTILSVLSILLVLGCLGWAFLSDLTDIDFEFDYSEIDKELM